MKDNNDLEKENQEEQVENKNENNVQEKHSNKKKTTIIILVSILILFIIGLVLFICIDNGAFDNSKKSNDKEEKEESKKEEKTEEKEEDKEEQVEDEELEKEKKDPINAEIYEDDSEYLILYDGGTFYWVTKNSDVYDEGTYSIDGNVLKLKSEKEECPEQVVSCHIITGDYKMSSDRKTVVIDGPTLNKKVRKVTYDSDSEYLVLYDNGTFSWVTKNSDVYDDGTYSIDGNTLKLKSGKEECPEQVVSCHIITGDYKISSDRKTVEIDGPILNRIVKEDTYNNELEYLILHDDGTYHWYIENSDGSDRGTYTIERNTLKLKSETEKCPERAISCDIKTGEYKISNNRISIEMNGNNLIRK